MVTTTTGSPTDWYDLDDCFQYDFMTRQPYHEISCVLREFGQRPIDPTETSLPQILVQKLAWWLSRSYQPWEFTTPLEPPRPRIIGYTILASAMILAWGKVYMSPRRPVPLRWVVLIWNLLWGSLALVGFSRLLPRMVWNLHRYTLPQLVCQPAAVLWKSGTTGFWSTLWIYWKLIEIMVESLLVVLLKQPCSIWQWFNNYAYLLVHGYHLVVSDIPGGIMVLTVYYGIVAGMNGYCGYNNYQSGRRRWSSQTQQQQPQQTSRKSGAGSWLDVVHLVQTLSGVGLSIVTLHYWKEAVYNAHYLHTTLHNPHDDAILVECHANERHIRLLAFGWSGGHVVIWTLQWVVNYFIARAVQAQLREDRKLQRRRHRKRVSLRHNTVSVPKKARNNVNKREDARLPEMVVEEIDISQKTHDGQTTVKKRRSITKSRKIHPDPPLHATKDTSNGTDGNESKSSQLQYGTIQPKRKTIQADQKSTVQVNTVTDTPVDGKGKKKSE